MLRLRFNLIIIIILIFAYSTEKLTVLRDEVVNTSQFVEYYSTNTDEDGEQLLESNFFTIEREYVLTGEKLVKMTPEDLEAAKKIEAEREEQKKKEIVINEYTVKRGDTIEKIAKDAGVSEEIIKFYNPKSQKVMKVGDKLQIPAANVIRHKVVRGDSLFKIARKYRVKMDDISDYNNLEEKSINVGDELYIKDPDLKRFILEVTRKEERELEKKKEKEGIVAGNTFLMPIRYEGVNSPYGSRRHPVLKKYIFHAGVDLRARYIPLKASQEGKVTFAGYKSGYGKIIIISHGNGFETRYAHLDKINVKSGEKVARGEVIGVTGNSGRSTGPHLHFEVRKGGKTQNPMNYIMR